MPRLLDRLVYEPRRNAKLRLLADYFRHTPDPDRGYALAALTDALMFKEAKPNVIRGLVEERVDPVLFRMSYHYVGDLAETMALIWPADARRDEPSVGTTTPPRSDPPRSWRPWRPSEERSAGPARRLARRPRRDRALGAAEADHPRAAGRRLGAARQDRRGRCIGEVRRRTRSS